MDISTCNIRENTIYFVLKVKTISENDKKIWENIHKLITPGEKELHN